MFSGYCLFDSSVEDMMPGVSLQEVDCFQARFQQLCLKLLWAYSDSYLSPTADQVLSEKITILHKCNTNSKCSHFPQRQEDGS